MKNSTSASLLPAVFLDRDGVICKDLGYVYKPEDLTVLPGVGEALVELKKRGYLLIVITNQSGVARGYFGLDDVAKFHEAMQTKLEDSFGVRIDGFFVSPFHPKGEVKEFTKVSPCRKPGIKLIEDAVKKHGIDLKRSFMVGDKKSDIDCAINAGIPGIQVKNDKGYDRHDNAFADVDDLLSALAHIQ